MKSKPKPNKNTTKIKSSKENPKNQINNNNKKSQNSKEVTSQKNKVKQTQNRNSGLKETKTHSEKSSSNYKTNNNNNKKNLKKTLGERIQSSKEIQTTRELDLHKKIYEKICAAQKEKRKIRTNSACDKKNQNKTKTNKVTEEQKKKVLLYINEKDLSELDNNNDNGLGSVLNILNIHVQIEYEIINIMKDIKNIIDRKNIYKNMFEHLNTFLNNLIHLLELKLVFLSKMN
jgi:hypothetical protein